MSAPTVASLLRAARAQALDPLDAQLLLAHVTGRSRAWLYAHADDEVDAAAAAQFLALSARRTAGEPFAYLTGEREFYGRAFRVTPDVLIPRADTECLLEAALAVWPASAEGVVVDAGTGSGALAVSFALERPIARVLALDRSRAALGVAAGNARALGASVEFIQSDWLAALADASVDLVLSNPPYLADDDPHLAGAELAFEPCEALVAGPDGLEDIRKISGQARRVLLAGGHLLFEHGWTQGPEVRSILLASGFVGVETFADLEARERATLGRRA